MLTDIEIIIKLVELGVVSGSVLAGFLIIRSSYDKSNSVHEAAVDQSRAMAKEAADDAKAARSVSDCLDAKLDSVKADLRLCRQDHLEARLANQKLIMRIEHLEELKEVLSEIT